MKSFIFLLFTCLPIVLGCKFSKNDAIEDFGFKMNIVRLQKCLPIVESNMNVSLLNDSTILYSYGRLDTGRNAHHFSKRILYRDKQVVQEEDEFFLPTASNRTSYFVTVKHHFEKDSTSATLQHYFWNDAFRTKSYLINYPEAKQFLAKNGLRICREAN
ncbi:hypothetical protein HRH25_03320 [Flavisolibacter sp. BT320]|nr:hypothetical protein [Flavisolibacter longurius]